MARPLFVLTLPDLSTVAVWPATGRATVIAREGGQHDQDREPCLATDFAGFGSPPRLAVCQIVGVRHG